MIDIFSSLLNRSAIIIILAFFLSRIPVYKRLVLKKDISIWEKITMGILFGIFGIIGTYSGIPVNGAIANSRVIGVFVGGWLGGPMVGLLSGLIAGGHRWGIDIGGFTAFACALSTIVEGVIGGFCGRYVKNNRMVWFPALITGAIAEIIQMVIILAVAKPFPAALRLVEIIWFPMVFTNAIGISIFIAITQSIFNEQERIEAHQAKLVLNIANQTLPYLRRGLNVESVENAAAIIYQMTNLAAVAITDCEKILAHVGKGSDHHLTGSSLLTSLTKETIATGEYRVAMVSDEIGCTHEECPLKSAVIVPLHERDKIIGTLKLYKEERMGITNTDIQLALGLAQLFSTQLELGKLEYQQELLTKAEFKALQAQINPHFLFNALNTISSFIRTKPEKARDLIIHLSDYFRQSLQFSNEDIPFMKEIKNIESYLAIELARFGEKLNIVYDIPQDIRCDIPPLILQPIVENAVKHGIFPKEEGGTVTIRCVENTDDYEISVIDDGIGIDPEKLKDLMIEKPSEKHHDGIGLMNVNKRLMVKYGEKNGLQIRSEVGKGTTVKMIIPRQ
ncbi:MAG: LytS/YhcK type 5TM receptor domain-containing protein [Bacillota bacterium]